MADGRPTALACVVLAHDDPVQVRRLVAALHPFPVFLHCDSRTSDEVFAQMTADLPERVVVLRRRRTPWAGWGSVDAELDGYRRALATTGASHVAVLSGADYPLVPAETIEGFLRDRAGRSIAWAEPLPKPGWGRDGGYWRFRYRFTAWRKHMLWLPIPRPLPAGIVLAGGSQWKVLARPHVEALLRAVDQHPDLLRRWRHTWIPDETFVYSVLHTPGLVPGWAQSHTRADPWVIRWSDDPGKSPVWLTSADLDLLHSRRLEDGERGQALFARKFSTRVDTAVLDAIDLSFRDSPV